VPALLYYDIPPGRKLRSDSLFAIPAEQMIRETHARSEVVKNVRITYHTLATWGAFIYQDQKGAKSLTTELVEMHRNRSFGPFAAEQAGRKCSRRLKG